MSTTILAIESSCDETAVAVLRHDGDATSILASEISSQIDIHREFGGVVPELASRDHIRKTLPLVRQTLDGVRVQKRTQLRRIDPDLLRQLARLGNNLNQLARWANRDQRYAESAAVIAQLVEIDRELAELRRAYEAPPDRARVDAD